MESGGNVFIRTGAGFLTFHNAGAEDADSESSATLLTTCAFHSRVLCLLGGYATFIEDVVLSRIHRLQQFVFPTGSLCFEPVSAGPLELVDECCTPRR